MIWLWYETAISGIVELLCVSASFMSVAWRLLKSICCTCSASPTYNHLVVYNNLRYVMFFGLPFSTWAEKEKGFGVRNEFILSTWLDAEPLGGGDLSRPYHWGQVWDWELVHGCHWSKIPSNTSEWLVPNNPLQNLALCSYVEWYNERVKSLEKNRSSDDRLQAMTLWAFAVWGDVWVDRRLNRLTVDSILWIQPGAGTASGHHACGNPKLPHILRIFEVL